MVGMKAKNHITFGGIVLIIIVFLLANPSDLHSLVKIDSNSSMLIATFLIFGIIGTILPDADSNNCGSRIFYTVFFPIAFFVKFLEYPIAKLLKRQIRHRGSLHTLVGVIITSITTPVVLFLIYIIFCNCNLDMYLASALMCSIIGLFIGQITHLIADFHFKFK